MIPSPKVLGLYISPVASQPMQSVPSVMALEGQGLQGDRYATGEGNYNKGKQGKRQVTLINAMFFPNSGFDYVESRRNIVVEGVELMWLIGREFQIGQARMRGVKYCDPCNWPSMLADKGKTFKEAFYERGGLIAEVLEGGEIAVGDEIVPPEKPY